MITRAIPFEIHLTIGNLTEESFDGFAKFCLLNDGKPLLIELANGEHPRQAMFSKVIRADCFREALAAAKENTAHFAANKFRTKRLKIEVPAQFAEQIEAIENTGEKYFEWHGKINLSQPEQLDDLCLRHSAHLSRNALRGEASARFLTLREFGAKTIFEQRVENLIEDLRGGNWQILKQEAEFCLYDDNLILDKGWLPK